MRRSSVAVLAILMTLAAWLPVPPVAAAPVLRKSPELTLSEPSGKPMQLSSLKGKVVVVEFLLTNCPHCWRLAQTIAKLRTELGPRGFHPVAVAFDANITAARVTDFVGRSRIAFPVGYTTADQVDAYLGREGKERFQVPQLVVIDRAGMIRAQSLPTGEKKLEDESYLRTLIDGLLKEDAPAGSTAGSKADTSLP